jgi:hypothetical protein
MCTLLGDVALFPYGLLGIETRVEHEDHAIASGFYAGQAMAGAAQPYEHIPMFYSELFDIRYEAVGLSTASWRRGSKARFRKAQASSPTIRRVALLER